MLKSKRKGKLVGITELTVEALPELALRERSPLSVCILPACYGILKVLEVGSGRDVRIEV